MKLAAPSQLELFLTHLLAEAAVFSGDLPWEAAADAYRAISAHNRTWVVYYALEWS